MMPRERRFPSSLHNSFFLFLSLLDSIFVSCMCVCWFNRWPFYENRVLSCDENPQDDGRGSCNGVACRLNPSALRMPAIRINLYSRIVLLLLFFFSGIRHFVYRCSLISERRAWRTGLYQNVYSFVKGLNGGAALPSDRGSFESRVRGPSSPFAESVKDERTLAGRLGSRDFLQLAIRLCIDSALVSQNPTGQLEVSCQVSQVICCAHRHKPSTDYTSNEI
jgi:hypothetical protein